MPGGADGELALVVPSEAPDTTAPPECGQKGSFEALYIFLFTTTMDWYTGTFN